MGAGMPVVGSSGVSAVLLPQEASASVKIVQAKIANNLFFIRVSSFSFLLEGHPFLLAHIVAWRFSKGNRLRGIERKT